MISLYNQIYDDILLENSIEKLIYETFIKRNHGSQYKGSGNFHRMFSNIFQIRKELTNIYISTHFTDNIRERIDYNADLTHSEAVDFKIRLPNRITEIIKAIHKKYPLSKLIDREHCFVCWFPSTKDTFIVCLDKDYKDNESNALIFVTILPRITDESLPKMKGPNDEFLLIND